MGKEIQRLLFDAAEIPTEWEKEWVGMPEYVQKDKKPEFQIIVSFANWQDVQKFAQIMGMNVGKRTNSTWFPHRPHTKYTQGYKSQCDEE